jgi:hypothetical protein
MFIKKINEKIKKGEIFLLSCVYHVIKSVFFTDLVIFLYEKILVRIKKLQKLVHREEKAQKWWVNNQWFGKDMFLTNCAMEIQYELKEENYDLKSDEYYRELETRIYKMFPERIKKHYSHNN